ncbi:hypothetical protein TDB9533_01006 [Thalassocella blandensis]|nr:hypothetical protein TDB9533_01006 [Thalassocella blandensis]
MFNAGDSHVEHKVDIKQALRVFYKIREGGKKQDDDTYVLQGINAYSDYDGYNVSLFNDYVRLDIRFHNSFNFEGSNQREKDSFLEKLALMDKSD